MSPRALAVSGALLFALAVPAAAEAAVTIEPLSKPCYVTAGTRSAPQGEQMAVRAHGFTPNAPVDVFFNGATEPTYSGVLTDANGSLGVLSPFRPPAPWLRKGSAEFSMTITEQGNPANTATVTSRHVALGVKVKPRQARPSEKIRFSGGGFTLDKPVYAHYVYNGKVRRTVKMAGDTNRCGQWTKRARQIPVSDPKNGLWIVQFDQLKNYTPAQPTTHRSAYVQLQITVTTVIRPG